MPASLTDGFDYAILDWFQSIHNPVLTAILKVLSDIGEYGIVWIAIGFIFLFFKRTRYIGVTLFIAATLSLIISNGIIKNLAARSRPCWIHPEVELLVMYPKDYSFPSGHASAGFASAVAIFAWNRKLGTAALVLSSLIAASRMYFYVHFPTDIIAGVLLGVLYGVTAYFIVRWFRNRKGQKVT